MKLLLVDDEIYILDMLKALIDWEATDLQLVGTATEGSAAFDSITTLRPDIVITDIRLPGFDGIELIKRVRLQNNDAHFIIISGFRQFEYAQNAIKYGVTDYLLKPIKRTELNEALQKLIRLISEERQKTILLKEQDKIILSSKNHLQASLLQHIIEKKELPSNLDVLNSKYLTGFKTGSFRLICCKIDRFSNTEPISEDSFFETIRTKIKENLTVVVVDYCHTVICLPIKSYVVFLLNYDHDQYAAIHSSIAMTGKNLFAYIKKFEGISLTIAIGKEVLNSADLSSSWDDVTAILQQRILTGCNTLLSTSCKEDKYPDIKNALSPYESRLLKKSIESFDLNALQTQIMDIFTNAGLSEIKSAKYYFKICYELADLFWNTLISIHIAEDLNRKQKDQELYELLDNCVSLRQLETTFTKYLLNEFKHYYDPAHPPENIAVLIAKKYIARHYNEHISLKDIANQIFLNPVYFSICFKRDTGLNFVDYINEYRIEKSKELLKNLQESIASIAETVGFQNARYFSKVFKKYVGISPAEYRRKHVSISL